MRVRGRVRVSVTEPPPLEHVVVARLLRRVEGGAAHLVRVRVRVRLGIGVRLRVRVRLLRRVEGSAAYLVGVRARARARVRVRVRVRLLRRVEGSAAYKGLDLVGLCRCLRRRGRRLITRLLPRCCRLRMRVQVGLDPCHVVRVRVS